MITLLYRRGGANWLPALLVFAIGIVAWQLLFSPLAGKFLLPRPSQIVTTLAHNRSLLIGAGWYTFREALGGFAIGSGLAIAVALVFARWRRVGDALMPYAVAANAVPIIAFAPIFNNVFGLQSQLSKMMVAATLCFFPVMINTVRGLLAAQQTLLAGLTPTPVAGTGNQVEGIVVDPEANFKNLIGYLSSQQKKYENLQSAYQSMYSKAKRELGAAKLQAAEDARVAAAAARARRMAGNGGGGAPADAAGGGVPARGSVDRGVGDPTPSAPLTNPPSGRAGIAVRAAYSQLGVPYRYAGATPGVAFDCSGLTMWAWSRAGVSLPHYSKAQYEQIQHVDPSDAEMRRSRQPDQLRIFVADVGFASSEGESIALKAGVVDRANLPDSALGAARWRLLSCGSDSPAIAPPAMAQRHGDKSR